MIDIETKPRSMLRQSGECQIHIAFVHLPSVILSQFKATLLNRLIPAPVPDKFQTYRKPAAVLPILVSGYHRQ